LYLEREQSIAISDVVFVDRAKIDDRARKPEIEAIVRRTKVMLTVAIKENIKHNGRVTT